MNKIAAEKIAREYYELGVKAALQEAGQTKTAAGLGPLKFRNANLSPLSALAAMGIGAGTGGAAAFKGVSELPIFKKGLEALDDSALRHAILNKLDPSAYANADAIRELAMMGGGSALGGAAMLGALGGGKLGLEGARKFLNKNAPIERYLDLGLAQIPLGKARI